MDAINSTGSPPPPHHHPTPFTELLIVVQLAHTHYCGQSSAEPCLYSQVSSKWNQQDVIQRRELHVQPRTLTFLSSSKQELCICTAWVKCCRFTYWFFALTRGFHDLQHLKMKTFLFHLKYKFKLNCDHGYWSDAITEWFIFFKAVSMSACWNSLR